jgi:hypothetical protein
LKNRATRATKKMKKIERRCMIGDDIDDCDCERLQDYFTALRSEYQEHHELTMIIVLASRRPSKVMKRVKKRVGYHRS